VVEQEPIKIRLVREVRYWGGKRFPPGSCFMAKADAKGRLKIPGRSTPLSDNDWEPVINEKDLKALIDGGWGQ
jgi:hypothetical protein